MSAMSFLAQMGIAKMGHIGDSITTAIINFDPETASLAQITEYRQKCDEIAHRVAKAEQDVTDNKHKADALKVKLDRDRDAARALRNSLGLADEVMKATLTGQAAAVIAQMKELGGDSMDGASSGLLFEATNDLAQAQKDLAEWQQVHQQAVQQLTTAESTLKHARDDLERAHRDRERAQAKQAQMEADAHLRGGLATGSGVALNAMAASAAKAREDARAATLQTEALGQTRGTDADAIVAATLKQEKPAVDVMDELSKL